ncbi:MAG: hypothetical protein JWQ94_3595 [Tardiphaga sp.]|jgi:CelD/BcsL family acetyltransferase involved in cellulose biosynthesis|nr:hypothetical protein [Tardiphaga sp.]
MLMAVTNGNTLHLDVEVGVEPDFDFLSDEYRAFFDLSRGTVFQAPLWQAEIHRLLLPALAARPYTVTVRSRADRGLLVVIPFVVQKSAGINILQPADFGVCDYNAIVADPMVLEALAADRTVVDRLDALLDVAGVMMFRKARDDGFSPARLFRKTTATPCENAAYHIETGPDFEVWQRSTVSRKFTKELGRLARQVERDFGRYEHRVVQDEQDIREAFAFLQSVRRGRFEGDLLDNEVYASFYLEFAVAGAKSGDANTYVSYLDGMPVAVLLGVAYADQCHAVLIGSDTERFGKYSLGMQLLYRIVKLRFGAGLHRLDLGLGNTGYKSMFRVEETTLHNFTSARILAGAAISLVYHHAKPLKNLLRRLAPRLR